MFRRVAGDGIEADKGKSYDQLQAGQPSGVTRADCQAALNEIARALPWRYSAQLDAVYAYILGLHQKIDDLERRVEVFELESDEDGSYLSGEALERLRAGGLHEVAVGEDVAGLPVEDSWRVSSEL